MWSLVVLKALSVLRVFINKRCVRRWRKTKCWRRRGMRGIVERMMINRGKYLRGLSDSIR